MAESLVTQTVIGFSTAPESQYGVSPVLANAYTPMTTRAREQPVPESEKTDDRGVIGRGNAMYPSTQRSGFRVPTPVTFTDIVQATTFATLLRRYMGATAAAPVIQETGVAWRHTFYELNPDNSLQLPSSGIIYQNNEYDYLLQGGVGSTLQIAQENTTDPNYTLAMVGSGMAKRISQISPAFGALEIPPIPPQMYGASTAVQYTNNSSIVVSLTQPSHKWRGSTFSANNNLDTSDTRAGMPQVDDGEPKRGWYRDFLHFGDREISEDFTMGMDGSYELKDAEELNIAYTNYVRSMFGDVIPDSEENTKFEVSIVIPKFYLRTPRTGDANNKRTKTFTLFPVIHAAHYGVYRFEVVNDISTAMA